MRTETTVAGLRDALLDAERRSGRSVGLVPTMGFLHEGHVSLIERARGDNDVVATTIFVNPLQFAPTEDLSAYPRDPDGDAAKVEAAGSDVLFTPSVEEMYPGGRSAVRTSVDVSQVTEVMEGASRPTHFAGVCTVVAKLFNIAGPCRAYFGEKDYQQLAVIRAMVRDLSIPVEAVGCPIVREPDGLALFSRNVYLEPDEREAAPVLNRALRAGAAAIAGGERSADAVRDAMVDVIRTQNAGVVDYVEVADPVTLAPLVVAHPDARLFAAVRFGRARLRIDNISASEPGR